MAKLPKNISHQSASRDMEKITQLIQDQQFGSVEEMQAFVDKNVVGKKIDDVLKKFKGKKTVDDNIMDLVDKAYATSPDKAFEYIQKALKLDPENPNALFFLAEHEEDTLKAIDITKTVINISKQRLGESFFLENKGNFWLIHKTRPFMRAMNLLGSLLTELKKDNDAMSVYAEMIELNPNDNQGIRDVYAPLLVQHLHYDKYRALRKMYPEEFSAIWKYLYSIYLFRTAGTVTRFYEALNAAYKTNPHFVHITVGIIEGPEKLASYYSPGDEDEAYYAMGALLNLVDDSPGFIYEFGKIPGIKEKVKAAKFNKKHENELSIFPVAKYPCEFLAFITLDFKIEKEDATTFFAVDAYTEFAIYLDAQINANDDTVIEKINELLEHPDFTRHTGAFTIVMDDFEHLHEKIKKIIEPVNGKLLFSKPFTEKIVAPFLDSLDELVEKK